MNEQLTLKVIGHIHTDFPEKFGLPRQSGLVEELRGTIVFTPEYRVPEALREIEQYSHLWLIWGFSEAVRETWSPTVRPPRLGGNKRVGVFATRSPFRPNALGLSCVKFVGVRNTAEFGTVLEVAGIDMMDGTPIYDIKPYLPYVDSHPNALGGFAEEKKGYALSVECSETLLAPLTEEQKTALLAVLSQDPRPSYQQDPERIYGMDFADVTVKFKVENDLLKVVDIKENEK